MNKEETTDTVDQLASRLESKAKLMRAVKACDDDAKLIDVAHIFDGLSVAVSMNLLEGFATGLNADQRDELRRAVASNS